MKYRIEKETGIKLPVNNLPDTGGVWDEKDHGKHTMRLEKPGKLQPPKKRKK